MQSELKEIQKLVHKCLNEDSNNPKWDTVLLNCLAKLEHYAEIAIKQAGPDEDPLFLTRPTVRQFKAVK